MRWSAGRKGGTVKRMALGGLAAAYILAILALDAAAQGPASVGPEPPTAAAPPAAGRRDAQRQRRAEPSNLRGHGGPIKTIAADPATGRVLTGSFDYSMMLWDTSTEESRPLARLEDHGGAVNAVAFIPQTSRALAAGDDGRVALWDLDTRSLVHRFEGHEGKIVDIALSPDRRWAVSSSWDRTARLWDLRDLKPGPVLSGHKGPVNAAQFSADGRLIFTASADGSIGAWRLDGTFERAIHQHGWGLNVLLRLPDGSLAYGALNGSAGILDAASGTVLRDLAPGDRPILALAATEKPGLLAVGSGDGRIRVLRLPDGAEIEEYRNLFGPVWAMAFVRDGTALYYGGLDDFATLWRVAPRAPFEPLATDGPRRFQAPAGASDLVSAGQVQFARKCSICHTLEKDGANRAGPALHGIFGRKIATLPGYPYSDAVRGMDIVWNEDTIDKLFALGPDAFTPGSKMPLQRMTDADQRAALIAYLRASTGSASQAGIDGQGQNRPDSPKDTELKR